MGRLLWILALAAGLTSGTWAQDGRPDTVTTELGVSDRELHLEPGTSEILRFEVDPGTVLVGNPDIMNAEPFPRGLILTGFEEGRTNLIVLNREGAEILRASVRVGASATRVRIRRANKVTGVSCTPAICIEDEKPEVSTTSVPGPFGPTVTTTTRGALPAGFRENRPDDLGRTRAPRSSSRSAPGPSQPTPQAPQGSSPPAQ